MSDKQDKKDKPFNVWDTFVITIPAGDEEE